MKEQFKRCMQILYPQGLNWEKDKAQHRALIKCFSMAWVEAIQTACAVVNLPKAADVKPENAIETLTKANIGSALVKANLESMDSFRQFAIDDVYPDESWRWENHPAFSQKS